MLTITVGFAGVVTIYLNTANHKKKKTIKTTKWVKYPIFLYKDENVNLKINLEDEKPRPEDYEKLKDDDQFKRLKSLISNDPADDLDIVFENLLDSYVKYKTKLNEHLARLKNEEVSEH